jgi:hypothetical protein
VSTRVVLGGIGAAVGFVVGGGPQGAYWGWAIGSAAGNVIDPQIIKGPSLGEISQQTSQEGGPIPIVFGVSPPITGNIIATSEPRIVKKTSGKGGPKVQTETVFRTYAIGFAEGPVGSFLRVWRNNTKVYDPVDPEFYSQQDRFAGTVFAGLLPPLASRNAKFLQKARFFYGSYDQNASPDLEAVFGVGTTPTYRGLVYLVLADEELTDTRGMIPQWTVQLSQNAVPVLSDPIPSGTVADATEATIGATTTQSTGTLYVVVGTGSQLTGVTAEQIKNGKRANGSAALASGDAVVSDSTPTVLITGLTESTSYTYAIVQENVNGFSNIVTGTFATPVDGISLSITVENNGGFITGYVADTFSVEILGAGSGIGSNSLGTAIMVNGREMGAIYTVSTGPPRLVVHVRKTPSPTPTQSFFTSITINGTLYTTASADGFDTSASVGSVSWTWNNPAGGIFVDTDTYPVVIVE